MKASLQSVTSVAAENVYLMNNSLQSIESRLVQAALNNPKLMNAAMNNSNQKGAGKRNSKDHQGQQGSGVVLLPGSSNGTMINFRDGSSSGNSSGAGKGGSSDLKGEELIRTCRRRSAGSCGNFWR